MEGNKDGILTDIFGRLYCKGGATTTRDEVYSISTAQLIAPGCVGVYLHKWLRSYLVQLRNAARLRTRLVLRQHTPGRKVERIVIIYLFGGWPGVHYMKLCSPRLCRETLTEQARRTGMLLAWAGPEYSLLRLNLLIRYPCIICNTTCTGLTQFSKDLVRIGK